MKYELVDVTREADWSAYHAIRRDVLWTARGRPNYDDRHADEYLPSHHPLLLKCDGVPIGTTRLDERGLGVGVVRLVAIRQQSQRQGHGRQLARMVDARARQLGLTTLYVNAVSDAVEFYRKNGWRSFAFATKEASPVLKVSRRGGLPMRLVAVLDFDGRYSQSRQEWWKD